MTIKDIARKANVSVATVSRVINEYKWVSPEVRARVQKVIDEENYRPNYNASVMATGKSNMIAIVVPNLTSPFFAQFTGIVSARLKTSGYIPVLFQTDNNPAEEAAYFASLRLQNLGIPAQLVETLPYLVTILVLVIAGIRATLAKRRIRMAK